MNYLNRRRFLLSSAGLVAGSMLGCRSKTPAVADDSVETTFYGDAFDAFATSLYGELRKKDGNVFLSPYSISTALAMTAEGAKSNTLTQMQTVLGLPVEKSISEALAAKAKSVTLGPSRGYELATANALWPQKGYDWSPEYLKRVTETFRASVNDLDYTIDPEAARRTINDWVEKQTHDKIKELLAKRTIGTNTKLVLTNAIYFKGDWMEAFDKKQTREMPFTLLDDSKKTVPMMHRSAKIDYFADKQVHAIRLPYRGKEISFIGVLPNDPAKFGELDSKLTAASFAAWTSAMKPVEELSVWLPKFKFETTYVLNAPLSDLGMKDAFDDKLANFKGLTTGYNDLFITHVVHKAFIDVHEEGTEAAAAATAVVVSLKSDRLEPHSFRADRPFLFALRHEPTGTLLFLGRYSNPKVL